MYSKLDICNRALRIIGENRITSLEENSRLAEECRFLYPIIKREVIESYPWKCTKKVITLCGLYTKNSDENHKSKYKFLLPYDCIRVLNIDGGNNFQRDGIYIYAFSRSINVTYSADIEETYMTIRLVKILSLKLATELGEALMGDDKIVTRINNKLLLEYNQLKQLDSIEGDNNPSSIHFNETHSWLQARE